MTSLVLLCSKPKLQALHVSDTQPHPKAATQPATKRARYCVLSGAHNGGKVIR